MKNFIQLEKDKITAVANQYRKEGYEVIFEHASMPLFLRDVDVDMVALSKDDNVLIEVVSQASVNDRNKLEHLAKLVQNREKWRFEVIVTNPKVEIREGISLQETIDRIEQAKQLLSNEQPLASILLAWSSTESILRVLAENDDLKLKNRSPVQLTKTLYSHGTIGPSAYEILLKAAKQRNYIAHGYQEDQTDIDNEALAKELLEITSSLLSRLASDVGVEKDQLTSDELVEWFYEHYKDPANGVPFESREGGYQYFNGGPYDPWEVLADEFSWVHEEVIEDAANRIYPNGFEWVEIGQY
jgi:uncharacterized protein YutE (UPF0331/DUF86 family)